MPFNKATTNWYTNQDSTWMNESLKKSILYRCLLNKKWYKYKRDSQMDWETVWNELNILNFSLECK